MVLLNVNVLLREKEWPNKINFIYLFQIFLSSHFCSFYYRTFKKFIDVFQEGALSKSTTNILISAVQQMPVLFYSCGIACIFWYILPNIARTSSLPFTLVQAERLIEALTKCLCPSLFCIYDALYKFCGDTVLECYRRLF